jgi:hypothetical protein
MAGNHEKVCVPEVPQTVQDETISAPYGRWHDSTILLEDAYL